MSVKLTISVPDISQQIADGFDFIRVFRSTTGSTGTFVEVTADTPAAATIVGSVVGPFLANGKTILLRVNRGPTQSYVILTDPQSATQLAAQLNANLAGVLAADDGSGKLRISTTGTGTDEIIEFLGESDLGEILGFAIGQYDIGEATRIPMVDNITEYLFEDVAGSESDFYEIDFINSSTLATSSKSDPVKGSLVETVAKQQADTRSPRGLTLIRQSTHVFREAFFQDPEHCIPLEPLDASKYPSFQIVDINGQIVAGGLATQDGDPGHWRVEFFVPADAPISNDDRRWRIEWLFLDADNRQVEKTTEFDIRDVDVTASATRDQKLIAMCGKPFRIFIRELKRPFSLRLDVVNANNDQVVYVDGATLNNTDESLQIQETPEGETYVYHYTIPEAVLELGTYRATWTIEKSVSSAPEYAFTIIEVPSPNVLQFFPSLRMVIDKYQKRREIIQAYQDSDIHEYLLRGMDFMNSYHPISSYTFSTIPSQLVPYWLMAGQLWGLNAQFLLETDLQFSFCLEENELVRTTRGLVKIKDLVNGVDQQILASKMLVTDHDEDLFRNIHTRLWSGEHKTQTILDLCRIKDLTAQQLGLRFTKFNLNSFRRTDHAGGWLWDVEEFWDHLVKYGIQLVVEDEPKKLPSSFSLYSAGSTKELQHIWDLGKKTVYRVRTELGYETCCSSRHGFLVLDPSTFGCEWKLLEEINEGDLVAIDTTPEVDDDWVVEFSDDVQILNTNTSKSFYSMPSCLTPDLARVLGWLVSEGTTNAYNVVSFGTSDREYNQQFTTDFRSCFGKDPEYVGTLPVVEGSYAVDRVGEESSVEYYSGKGTELRRFLSSVGLGYTKSRQKEIPWCILQAPRLLVAEFLKTYVDGDGCLNEKELIFCSSSNVLRNQLQSLLLRFGIVSRNDYKNNKVTVRGPSLALYKDLIGFGFKDNPIKRDKFYPQREAIPVDLLTSIRNIRSHLPGVNSKGWYRNEQGDSRRVQVSWNKFCDPYAKYTTWDHVGNWWAYAKEDLRSISPALSNKLEFLLETKFLWQKVFSIEEIGEKRVLDPCLPDGDDLLSHGFTGSGFVMHNSGQTVTLDYDHTGNLDTAIQRAVDWLDKGLPQAKTALFRRSNTVGVMAGKPYRVAGLHQYTYKISTRSSQDFVNLLSNIGLL